MMENAGRYLIGCALAAVAGAALLALLVVAVDPYRAFNSPDIQGLNALKPRAIQQEGIAKSRILARLRPRTLLLGNSRVEVSLDPQSPVWPASWQPVVSGAQAGTGPDVALCRLNLAISGGKLQFAILGLDIEDFLVGESPEPTPAPPGGQGSSCKSTAAIWWSIWRSVVSIGGVTDSVLTLLGQDPRTGATMNADGFNPARDNMVHVNRIGYEGLFAAKIAAYRKAYAAKPAPMFDHPERYAPFRDLAAIMRVAATERVRLVIFIHPYHARYYDLLKELGLWPSYEAWKRQVRSLVDAENRGRSDPITLLDFSGYNEITTEVVPPVGGRDMQWYWEVGHYKQALGERLIQAILKAAEEESHDVAGPAF